VRRIDAYRLPYETALRGAVRSCRSKLATENPSLHCRLRLTRCKNVSGVMAKFSFRQWFKNKFGSKKAASKQAGPPPAELLGSERSELAAEPVRPIAEMPGDFTQPTIRRLTPAEELLAAQRAFSSSPPTQNLGQLRASERQRILATNVHGRTQTSDNRQSTQPAAVVLRRSQPPQPEELAAVFSAIGPNLQSTAVPQRAGPLAAAAPDHANIPPVRTTPSVTSAQAALDLANARAAAARREAVAQHRQDPFRGRR
jgi:hypothetical protein